LELTNLLYVKRHPFGKRLDFFFTKFKALLNFMGILFKITDTRWYTPWERRSPYRLFKKRIIYDWNEKQPAGTETGVPGICRAFGE